MCLRKDWVGNGWFNMGTRIQRCYNKQQGREVHELYLVYVGIAWDVSIILDALFLSFKGLCSSPRLFFKRLSSICTDSTQNPSARSIKREFTSLLK